MFTSFGKRETKRILLAHIMGLLAGVSVVCLVMCCHRKKTPAEKIKRAFKELEEKLEV
ncbi:MAG: hypothetical protein J6A85_03580 [Clostridia bacterium]|nr:hypothetical protein [Clostridia bacterium]